MQQKHTKSTRVIMVLFLVAFWVVTLWLLLTYQQNVTDWLKLRGYAAPHMVAALATDDTMTDYGRRLFYVNKPQITNGATFSQNCPRGGEKTVVLGCYLSGDNGIWLYDVTDSRLYGVEQVTAAHEMLHAGYARLSQSERRNVDRLLESYFEHGLTDQRVKDTIAAYQKSEPGQLTNEMHSVLGTEVAELPPELESYYKRYFTERSRVASFTTKYEAEFTSRIRQVEDYDIQLNDMKQTIQSSQATLTEQRRAIDMQQLRMDALNTSGGFSDYNALVDNYNKSVNTYNGLLRQTRSDIERYNEIVAKRNAVALEERQLAEALSSNSLPKTSP